MGENRNSDRHHPESEHRQEAKNPAGHQPSADRHPACLGPRHRDADLSKLQSARRWINAECLIRCAHFSALHLFEQSRWGMMMAATRRWAGSFTAFMPRPATWLSVRALAPSPLLLRTLGPRHRPHRPCRTPPPFDGCLSEGLEMTVIIVDIYAAPARESRGQPVPAPLRQPVRRRIRPVFCQRLSVAPVGIRLSGLSLKRRSI